MTTSSLKEQSTFKRITKQLSTVVLGGGAILGIAASAIAYTSPAVAQSPMDSWTRQIDLGNGLVDYKQGDLDGHLITIGTPESCLIEFWFLPLEYKSVSDALYEHPNAKPESSYTNENGENGCKSNQQYRNPYSTVDAYQGWGSGVTGTWNKELSSRRLA